MPRKPNPDAPTSTERNRALRARVDRVGGTTIALGTQGHADAKTVRLPGEPIRVAVERVLREAAMRMGTSDFG